MLNQNEIPVKLRRVPIHLSSDYIINNQRLDETYRLVDEVIDNLSTEALKEIFGGYENDVEKLLNTIEEETYRVIYGNGKYVIPSFNYLEKLTEEYEETLRCEYLNYFISSVLVDFEINWHHLEWCDLVQFHQYVDVVCSRDGGKSFFFSNAVPVWRMYRYKPYDHFSRRRDLSFKKGLLFSFSLTQAKELLETLKETIENNDIIRKKLYPEASKDKHWGAEGIKCKNGTTLRCKSFGSSVRGSHPHYAIVDDPLKDNVIYSKIQREKSINYFHSVIMNAVLSFGQVLVCGTPMHSADLHGDLRSKANIDPVTKKVKGWIYREYPIVFPDGKLLWKKRYGFEKLIEQRETQGSLIFSREKLCRPIISESSIFPYEMISKAFIGMEKYTLVNNIESFPIKMKSVILGCDFSKSANVGADYTCYATIGVDFENNYWLLNLYRAKGKGFFEQISTIKYLHNSFKYDLIVMEDNVFQSIFVEAGDKEGLPVYPVTTGVNKNDFKNGLPGIAVLFERCRMKFPRGDKKSIDTTDIVAHEFSTIAFTDKGLQSVGEHDDTCFSIWQGIRGKHFVENEFKFDFL